jgi:ribonuclease-3
MGEQNRLRELEAALEYRFKDPSLLEKALTHSSATVEENNKRLEFLGDAVLGTVVAEMLLEHFPEAQEGQLTKLKSSVVNRIFQSKLAANLGLAKVASFGGGLVEQSGVSHAVLSNLMEAVVGAMYLDGGLEPVREFARRHLMAKMDEAFERFSTRDGKSRLQEFAQRQMGGTPSYEIVEEHGPDHRKHFQAVTIISGDRYESGWGATKKEAERRAAELTLKKLTGEAQEDGPPEEATEQE